MMRYLLLILLPLLAYAIGPDKIIVQQVDPSFDVSAFKKDKRYKVLSADEASYPKLVRNVAYTNELFNHPVIKKKKIKWDILEKDLFYLRLREYSVSKLKQKYPKFSEFELKTLKESVK